MGSTGDDRKSTALYYAQEAVSHLGMTDQVDMLHGIQSSEAVYDSLSRMDGAKSLAYCDEFRSLLSVAKRKGTQDIIPRLASLYYCPARDSLNRHEDSTLVVNPFLSLIAATPAEYVQDLLGNMEIDGGFLNRFLTITGEVKEWKAIAPRPSGWDRFVGQVRDIKEHYEDADCLLHFTDESAALWTEFYIKWKTARRDWNERDRRLTARIEEHILKLTIVYSAINKQSAISLDALKTALLIGRWLKASTLNAFGVWARIPSAGGKGDSRSGQIQGQNVPAILAAMGPHQKGINGEMLTRIINSHVKNGHLKRRRGREQRGAKETMGRVCQLNGPYMG